MRYKNNKRIAIINTISIFLCLFLFHFVYEKFPNFLTAIFFPVNESLFEHLKLMYVTQVLVSLFILVVVKMKRIKVNNYFLAILLSTLFNLILFFLIFLPIYNRYGENLFLTMGIYLITLVISQYIYYLITTKFKHKDVLDVMSMLFLVLFWCILAYFTFHPMQTDFFFDPVEEKYGIGE